ncbi:hypothetical protein GCM10009775_23810 [Microbacterium aoyamense]|uniref:Amidohydrolase-related domain-containing protein n=1 Tax=Microbacterium aoyamense TaxID=344166 RepID=A0ABN2PSB8_9MICO|nr:amidohydrolase family protein [Microbacterium aoyamense]
MEIVDAQVHVWAPDTPERPWNVATGHKPHGPAEYTAEMVIAQMDAAGVHAGLVVPTSFEGDRNDTSLGAAHRFPTRLLAHGRWNMVAPDVARVIEEELEDPLLRGIRLTFNGAAARWIEDDVLSWLWPWVQERGIPVSMFPVVDDLAELVPIARDHPGLRLSIDHLGTSVPKVGYDRFDRIEQLEALAPYENVAVKVSALPISFQATYSPATVRRVVDLLLPWFGPTRMFWGSDYTRYPGESYGDTVGVFLEGIAHLDAGDQEYVMGRAVREWFGWPQAS